jgi:hypothetical protein
MNRQDAKSAKEEPGMRINEVINFNVTLLKNGIQQVILS